MAVSNPPLPDVFYNAPPLNEVNEDQLNRDEFRRKRFKRRVTQRPVSSSITLFSGLSHTTTTPPISPITTPSSLSPLPLSVHSLDHQSLPSLSTKTASPSILPPFTVPSPPLSLPPLNIVHFSPSPSPLMPVITHSPLERRGTAASGLIFDGLKLT